MKRIDLNCDMGESYGAWKMGADGEVMPHISSANIACGFHGGDPATIRKTVRLAIDHGVAIGAHPSLQSEEHTSELQSQSNLVCRLLLEKKKKNTQTITETQNEKKTICTFSIYNTT